MKVVFGLFFCVGRGGAGWGEGGGGGGLVGGGGPKV